MSNNFSSQSSTHSKTALVINQGPNSSCPCYQEAAFTRAELDERGTQQGECDLCCLELGVAML